MITMMLGLLLSALSATTDAFDSVGAWQALNRIANDDTTINLSVGWDKG
tara:strand:+ start:10604 stop:10750 length:147 start_codon:yes stop_codon:yes gene_type:complete